MRFVPGWILVALFVMLAGCTPGEEVPAQVAEASVAEPEAAEDENLVPEDGEEALAWLLAGNERFVAGTPRHDHESATRRASLRHGQDPFAIVLGCADSRVSPELLFDHGLGDLFVIRVAGNIVHETEAGSIEYAIKHLGTPLVIVLGHEGCGAVTAALGVFDHEPEELVALLRRIRPALEGIDPSLPDEERIAIGVKANVRQAVAELTAIAEREGRPEFQRALVVGAVYDLDTGRVHMLED